MMKRRNFIKKSLITGGSALAVSNIATAFSESSESHSNHPGTKFQFNLNYAPHDGMFENSAGKDIIDQIKFMSDSGFKAFEDNGMMGRTPEIQEKIGNELAKQGMIMGVFVIDSGDNWKVSLTTGKQDFKDNYIKTCKTAVEVAKRCNAKWMTFVPGYFDREKEMGFQTANVVDALRRGAEIFEPLGLAMVLEPLSDNPDLFLRTSSQGFMVCKAVNSPSCKILYDIYHMQRNEGNLINHIDYAWDEIGYFQIGDNPGRNEPTTGEINYRNVFRHIFQKDPKKVLGMEHGKSKPGKEGEVALINAYKEVDQFI
jgi:hydroxypyruvate isomerase